jgi:hypothetical protein
MQDIFKQKNNNGIQTKIFKTIGANGFGIDGKQNKGCGAFAGESRPG